MILILHCFLVTACIRSSSWILCFYLPEWRYARTWRRKICNCKKIVLKIAQANEAKQNQYYTGMDLITDLNSACTVFSQNRGRGNLIQIKLNPPKRQRRKKLFFAFSLKSIESIKLPFRALYGSIYWIANGNQWRRKNGIGKIENTKMTWTCNC